MRVLILSTAIDSVQRYGQHKYSPPDDVELATAELNTSLDNRLKATLFDYDVSVVHMERPTHHSIGYYENLPKLAQDCRTALEHGRCVICLPETNDFISERSHNRGMTAYQWLSNIGVRVRDDYGESIKASGAGQATAIQEYLKSAPKYYQIIVEPELVPNNRLAVVDGTEIAVGMEYQIGKGTIVILPPPLLDEADYGTSLARLIEVARRYYDRAQRRIPIGDEPEWLGKHLVLRAEELKNEIAKLEDEKARYDKIAYVLYGTGHELEQSVAFLLEDLGFSLVRQGSGANIDFKASYSRLSLGFAIEITGIRDLVKKNTTKIAQAWQYLSDRVGTCDEGDRLVIAANTQYHLDPHDRNPQGFSDDVIKLLGDKGVLLVTTLQLYEQWAAIQQGTISTDGLVKRLHGSSGLFR